jgi:hypothetical protein
MTSEQKEVLYKINKTLNRIKTDDRQNWLILLTCMDEIEKLIKENDNGNANSES